MNKPSTKPRTEAKRELHPHRSGSLQNVIFGLNEGLVTTFIFILAVSNLAQSKLVLVILGEVAAGGVSMALGGFLGL